MISEEKVKIMAEMARYEKNHGKDDFRVYKYEKKDYIKYLSVDRISYFDRIAVCCEDGYSDHEPERWENHYISSSCFDHLYSSVSYL